MSTRLRVVRVVSVASGPAALGLVVSYLAPRLGRRNNIRLNLCLVGFPASDQARSGLRPGLLGRLRFDLRGLPRVLTIEGRQIWAASPERQHAVAVEYQNSDQRRRAIIFQAYGIADADTAIGIALTDPAGLGDGSRPAWRDTFLFGAHERDDLLTWNWWPDYPPQGRRRIP